MDLMRNSNWKIDCARLFGGVVIAAALCAPAGAQQVRERNAGNVRLAPADCTQITEQVFARLEKADAELKQAQDAPGTDAVRTRLLARVVAEPNASGALAKLTECLAHRVQ
ncbi:hypothetical protein [Breoghania sp. L-A4]|uniref:hypothetical protein n=1 Tax=Breoghania sp. L-A4 TaxID=2304600 RepID=UPI000E360ADE|nr:hypothetical protein [Breoghania sp. L-A4]AXS40879.1 hypothetical protein D1F64_13570 [Breoghania sp. L-A4]